MTRRLAFCLFSAAFLFFSPAICQAVSPEVAAGMAAVQASPKALGLIRELATVPQAVGQTLALPVGVAEMALCPLPGPTLAHGMKNTVHGLKGPVKLVGTCIKLPFTMLGAAAGGSR